VCQDMESLYGDVGERSAVFTPYGRDAQGRQKQEEEALLYAAETAGTEGKRRIKREYARQIRR